MIQRQKKLLDFLKNGGLEGCTFVIYILIEQVTQKNFSVFQKTKEISKNTYEKLLILLAPFAPHIAEELWDKIGNSDSILSEVWPKYDSKKTITDKAEIAVQVDGKVRATIPVSIDDDEDSVKEKALSNENVKKWTDGKNINKVLYVKGKIISIVTG